MNLFPLLSLSASMHTAPSPLHITLVTQACQFFPLVVCLLNLLTSQNPFYSYLNSAHDFCFKYLKSCLSGLLPLPCSPPQARPRGQGLPFKHPNWSDDLEPCDGSPVIELKSKYLKWLKGLNSLYAQYHSHPATRCCSHLLTPWEGHIYLALPGETPEDGSPVTHTALRHPHLTRPVEDADQHLQSSSVPLEKAWKLKFNFPDSFQVTFRSNQMHSLETGMLNRIRVRSGMSSLWAKLQRKPPGPVSGWGSRVTPDMVSHPVDCSSRPSYLLSAPTSSCQILSV